MTERDIGIMSKPYNPYRVDSALRWNQTRILQGAFGPFAVKDRSSTIEDRLLPTVERITTIKNDWKERLRQNPQNREKLDTAVENLRTSWESLKKGGQEELDWTVEAIGLASAEFELWCGEQTGAEFELWDNQLSMILLLLLKSGDYPFGKLHTDNRVIELFTGEGKTFCYALTAAVLALRSEQILIIEPNYNSVLDHLKQLGGFFEGFLRIDAGGLTDILEKDNDSKMAYVFRDGQLIHLSGFSGRSQVWKSKIIFADPNSVGFDWLHDQQIDVKSKIGVPPLEMMTALVAEAENTLVDQARNSWIISRPAEGDEAWDIIYNYLHLNRYLDKDWTQEHKRELAQQLIFTIWPQTVTQFNQFVPGENQDFFIQNNQIVVSERGYARLEAYIAQVLQPFFDGRKKAHRWIRQNPQITQAVFDVYFAMKYRYHFLGKNEEPILLDEFGFPLDQRQLPGLQQIFLQLYLNWPTWLAKTIDTEDNNDLSVILPKLIEEYAEQITVSQQTDRIFPANFYPRFGRILGSSGSLVPAAQTFIDLYQAEAISLPRHRPLECKSEKELSPGSLAIRCIDGGPAMVDFFSDKETQFFAIAKRVQTLRQKGRAALIIMPDIDQARQLAKKILDASLITGEEELNERGTLRKITAKIEQQKVIITTWMAGRDVDLGVTKELKNSGGPETIVVGLLPTQPGLWQALQRSLRADTPGSRRLLLSGEDLQAVAYQHLFNAPPSSLYLFRKFTQRHWHNRQKQQMAEAWKKTLNGDKTAAALLFKKSLSYLAGQEYRRAEQLIFLKIRDSQLDLAKELFLKKFYRLNTKLRQQLWADFIICLETEFISFVSEPELRNLPFDLLTGYWRSRVTNLINRPSFWKRLKKGYIKSA